MGLKPLAPVKANAPGGEVLSHAYISFTANNRSRRGEGFALSSADPRVSRRDRLHSVDACGRTIKTSSFGDSNRPEDDVCQIIVYANPCESEYGQPITKVRNLASVEEMRMEECVTAKPLAVTRYKHDNLPSGATAGHVTEVGIVNYDLASGTKLHDATTETRSYDAYGNLLTSVTLVDTPGSVLGQIQTVELGGYDPWHLLPYVETKWANPTTSLVTQTMYDPISLLPLFVRDASGLERRTKRDRFGRPIREGIFLPTGQNYLLSVTDYLGEDPLDLAQWALGRRVRRSVATTWVSYSTGDINNAAPRTTTSFFDEVGRLRFEEQNLGGDYQNKILVSNHMSGTGLAG